MLNSALIETRDAPGNRRSSERRKTYLGSIIISPSGIRQACVIKNLSQTGARVVASCPVHAEEIRLVIRKTGEIRRARVRWRNGAECGLEFLDAPAASTSAGELDTLRDELGRVRSALDHLCGLLSDGPVRQADS